MSDNKQAFIDKLYEAFPDVRTTNTVTRAQIREVSSYMPQWLNAAKISRGLYALPGASVVKPLAEVKAEKGFIVDFNDTAALIPSRDQNFVPFGNYDDVETIIRAGIFYPVYIAGPTGNGKSTMVEQICAKHKKPLIRVNLNMMSDEEQLIGSKTLEDGNVEIVEGPVLIAMRTGATLLLDECDAGSANTLLCLQPILEGKPYYFKLKNEIIVPAPGFNIFATANTKGKGSDDGRYIGTNVLNEAFLERFAVTFEQQYPPAKTERKIIENLMTAYNCLDEGFSQTLVKWADAIRRTFEDGGIDENITTRRMTHIVRAFSIFKDKKKAVELACNRFDQNTKEAFIDLFDKVSNEPEGEQPVVQETVVDSTQDIF
jgi:MoxR-like ATPase